MYTFLAGKVLHITQGQWEHEPQYPMVSDSVGPRWNRYNQSIWHVLTMVDIRMDKITQSIADPSMIG
jgi:hypothetical protein